jgi:hypothetical protein
VLRLSLIPNSQKKFTIIDIPKEISIELRCLPALELLVAIPKFYPSNGQPLFQMTTPFYEPFKETLYSNLENKWTPDTPVLYDYSVFIQNELIDTYFESGSSNPSI